MEESNLSSKIVMENNIDSVGQDELFEALTTTKIFVKAGRPMLYDRGTLYDDYWGWVRNKKEDIVYLNNNGVRHKLYGPSYISLNFDIEAWYKEGKLHRVGGPAYRHKKSKFWCFEGKLHRLDGPAVDMEGNSKQYWIHGQQWSPKNYKKEIERRRRKGLIK